MSDGTLVPAERIDRAIHVVRGHKILLDEDLAELYGVETRVLVRNVKRNLSRFPADFLLQLKPEEWASLRSQIGISKGRGGRRYPPYAFTEQGVAMLSSVLHSSRAIQVNIEIMRAFVRMREMAASHRAIAQRLELLEKRYAVHDVRIRAVFTAIRRLMQPPSKPRRRIGFVPDDER